VKEGIGGGGVTEGPGVAVEVTAVVVVEGLVVVVVDGQVPSVQRFVDGLK